MGAPQRFLQSDQVGVAVAGPGNNPDGARIACAVPPDRGSGVERRSTGVASADVVLAGGARNC